MYYNQRTLAGVVSCSGIGLHSGKPVCLTIKPAPVNSGIEFVRVDLPGKPKVKALFGNVVDTSLATVIGEDGCIVSTIEHLMASFAGMFIDNALVEVNAYEVPIIDGSAKHFIDLICKVGIKIQNRAKVAFLVKEPIKLIEDDKSVVIYPSNTYKISCTIDYPHPLIDQQTFLFNPTIHSFKDEIASARTFCFFKEVEAMKSHGLARGGSLDNAIVLNDSGVMNKTGLRFENEFVRHKILDCIGDFSLLGVPIIGHVVTIKSGHRFNLAFLEKFFEERKLWETHVFDII